MPRLTDTRVASIKPPATGQEEHPDDLVTGLRLRVGAGGRKAWIVRTRAGGKPINKTLGAYPTLKLGAARDSAKAFLIDIAKNGAPTPKRTFGELADLWIERVAKPNNRSWELQKRRLEIHVLPKWRERDLASIRRADVRELVEGIEGDVAPNRVLTLVRTLFRYALARDWLGTSPAEAIGKPRQEAPRDRFLDMTEARRAYAASDLLGYPFGGFIKLLFLTGQRRSEVAGMRWVDLDLKESVWILGSEDVKSGRKHLVPLTPAALAILEKTPRLGEFVWTDNGRTPVSGFSKVKTRLDSYIAAQGDALEPWVLHDIRRTVATHLVRLGVSETIVGRVLNHAPQGVTARTYALHTYAPEKGEALERWAAELESAQ